MNFLLALLSAILLILIFPRFDWVWLAPLALTPLLLALGREDRPGRRALLGYCTGVVYWFGVCYWIQFVLSFHGGLGDLGGWAVFLLFCLAKALHMAAFAFLAGLAFRTCWAAPGIAACWVAVEVTHGWLGFAWLALGNAGIAMGLPMRLAPIAGVYGLSFVFALMSSTLALALLRRPRRDLLWIFGLAPLFVLPHVPEYRSGTRTAVLVQPNISETEQWTSDSVQLMHQKLLLLSMRAALRPGAARPDIIAWPEVPAPLYLEDARLRQQVADLARVAQSHLLLGMVAHAADGAAFNSAIMISPDGEFTSRYDKIKLVPFGEFVPWPFGFANKISTEIGDFRAGEAVVVSKVGDHRLGTFICYESAFPPLVRGFVSRGAEVLFNLSNDGYFGKTSAREQHLKIVRMRAAENQRWIVRATNDGITATVDPAGRVERVLDPYNEAAATARYSYLQAQTFYTRHGDWFALLCAIAGVGSAATGWPLRSRIWSSRRGWLHGNVM